MKLDPLHSVTATICSDHQPPSELKEPAFRRMARCLLLAAVGACVVAGIVWMAMREPAIQIDRTTISPSRNVTSLFEDADRNNQSLTCPCQVQEISWCNYTTFFIYLQAGSDPAEFYDLLNITVNGGDALPRLCNNTDWKLTDVCISTLSPIFNKQDSRTFLSTANLMPRPLLYSSLGHRIDTTAYEQSNSHDFLQFESNETQAYNYSSFLTSLLRDMAGQFLANSSSSAEDFWLASAVTRQNHTTWAHLSFGMELSWDKYEMLCGPLFCDEIVRVSLIRRVLQAISQLGGLGAVVLMVIKFLLWPAVRTTFGFPGPE